MVDEENFWQPEPEPAVESSQEMTVEQRAEARQYGRVQLMIGLIDKVVDLAYLGVVVFALSPRWEAWLSTSISNDWLRLIALLTLVIGLHECVSLPLSYFGGFVIEHRYALSKQNRAAWLRRHFESVGLGFLFTIVMFVGLFAVIRWTGPWWWLVAAVAFFAASVLLGQLAPVLILPLFYKIEPLDHAELTERMERLSEGTGLSIEGVYRMRLSEETAKANAMLAGLGRTRRVLMGDTLLDRFSADEIEVIFAHEIGHHVYRHIHKMIFAGLLYSAVGFWLCDALMRAWLGHADATIEYSTLPASAMILLMFALTIFSMVIEPVQNAVSRRFERQCDRYALQRTGLHQAYRSAFCKLARLNKDDPDPPWLEVMLFHSHPPISERLALADE